MVLGAGQGLVEQIRDHVLGGSLVKTASPGEHVHHVELVEQHGTRLVDGADDGPPLLSEQLEQRHTLRTGRTVQTSATRLISFRFYQVGLRVG